MDILHDRDEAQPESYKSDYAQSWTDFSNAHTDSLSSRLSIIEQAVQRKANTRTQGVDQESETVAESEQADQTDSQASSAQASYCGTKQIKQKFLPP